MSTNEKGTPQSRTYTVNDIAAILGIGRASAYKLANSGLFKTIRIGNMIRISRKSFEDFFILHLALLWSREPSRYPGLQPLQVFKYSRQVPQ